MLISATLPTPLFFKGNKYPSFQESFIFLFPGTENCPFSLTCCPPSPKPRRTTHARAEVCVNVFAVVHSRCLAGYQCSLQSDFALVPFLVVELNSCPLFFCCLPSFLSFALQHLCLWRQGQRNIYFWCVPGYTNLQKYWVQ